MPEEPVASIELPCIVRWIRYPKRENLIDGYCGFALLSCELDPYSRLYKPEMEDLASESISDKYDTFTVCLSSFTYKENCIPNGQSYVFIGNFIKDAKWGWQFKADFYYQDIPSNEDSLKKFLMTLPNIKEERSNAIISRFGVEGTIDILDNNPMRLIEISGINAKRVPPIVKVWEEKKCLRSIYHWFVSKGLPVSWVEKAFELWDKDVVSVLESNPYKLSDIRGIGFVTADQEAHKISDNIPESFRVKACIQYVLNDYLYKHSHLCMPYTDLKKQILSILKECDQNLGKNIQSSHYLQFIPDVIKNNLDEFSVVKDITNDTSYVYLKSVWEKEVFIAKSIYDRKTFDKGIRDCSDFDIEDSEKNASVFNKRDIKLDESQKQAIKSAFMHKLTVITGAGGTGKSTICRCIYYLASKKGLTIRMVSPTGKASQVLSDKTGCQAATIHRSLRMMPGYDEPKDIISEDILLVDEISMCGIDTIYAIFKAMSSNLWGNIVLVGDKNQLPSVSPGNFLSDIMNSGCANIIKLDKIHRQDENSYIPVIANAISNGKVTEIPKDAHDIKWHALDVSTFHSDILSYIDSFINSGKDISQLQIISPMKKGDCGVFKLNDVIQEKIAKINNEDRYMVLKYNKFFVGDRVIQVENNYDKMIFNGDIGTVVDLGEKVADSSVSDEKEKFIIVDFYGEKFKYIENEFNQLQLAWAITVHKFQGSQAPYILFVMAKEQDIMMSKELVYTAFTRAEKKIDIFGNDNMLRKAPTRSIIRKRYTNLVKKVEELSGNKQLLKVLSNSESKNG